MNDLYDRIADLEGYYAKPYWDYKQWSVGHGTRASGPNDVVDPAEARRRLQVEVDKARASVDQVAGHLDPGTRDALTSLAYNVGTGPLADKSGLADAIRSGDPARIRERLLQYTKAGGDVLPGLVRRRETEASWIGQGASSSPNTPPILTANYGRESGPGFMPPSPSGAAAVASAEPTTQSWLGKALGLTPSQTTTMSGLADTVGAFGKAQGGGDDSRAAQLRQQAQTSTQAAFADEEARAQAALKQVLARRSRSAFA